MIDIAQNFDRASRSYEDYAIVQKASAQRLVQLLPKNFCPRTVLDIGCGTGFVTERIIDSYPNSQLTLCDISLQMLKKAQAKFSNKNISYLYNDAETMPLDQNYDLVISNCAFQWFQNPQNFCKKIQKRCGFFAFSTLLDDSFTDFTQFLIKIGAQLSTLSYYTSDDWVHHLDFVHYETEVFTLQFPHAWAAAQHFVQIGANHKPQPRHVRRALWQAREKINLTYHMFFGLLKGAVR